MIDLPRYVKPQKKPSGRVIYYYERYRGTPRAWPRVPLIEAPSHELFWTRCRHCERLEATKTDGDTWAWTYRLESGRTYPLPDPKDDGFWPAVEAAEAKERKRLASVGKTFQALVDEYREHEAYKRLSESAKAEYDRHIDAILAAWADDPVRDLTSVDAQKAVDAYQDTPRSGEQFRMVLTRLVNFGIPRGYSETNPAEKTEKIPYDAQPYKPWPDWAFQLFFEHARIALHLPVYSALFTGQRSVDVIPMMRPRRDAKQIELIARKTGEQVWVPILSDYRDLMEVTRADHTRLHLREDGEAWTVAGYRTAWSRAMEMKELKPLRDDGLVFHGLRKNAVNMLLEAGCSEAMVSAIVEMSEAMVRHYARDVNKRRLAVAGMKKLEEGWKEARANLFGGARSPLLRNSSGT